MYNHVNDFQKNHNITDHNIHYQGMVTGNYLSIVWRTTCKDQTCTSSNHSTTVCLHSSLHTTAQYIPHTAGVLEIEMWSRSSTVNYSNMEICEYSWKMFPKLNITESHLVSSAVQFREGHSDSIGWLHLNWFF